jgi:succinylglutamate desuccinylase
MSYTRSQLEETAERLYSSIYEGVPGVVLIESPTPGPVVGITVCTHGNEPAGLAAARSLFEQFENHQALLCGKLFIVLNNIEACKKFFNANSPEEKSSARFIDTNLNRLPEDLLAQSENKSYEIHRARELMPVWSRFDIGLDIHSTTQADGSMILSLGNTLYPELIRGFPIPRIVSNIDSVQIGRPAAHFYGSAERSMPKTLAIECGMHEDVESFDRAIACAHALLQNLSMLPGQVESVEFPYEEYQIHSSVVFPDDSYQLTRLFKNFEFIPDGTVLAEGAGENIVADGDGHTLFASKIKPTVLTEEVLFLTFPKKIRSI